MNGNLDDIFSLRRKVKSGSLKLLFLSYKSQAICPPLQEFGGNHDRDTVIYRDLNPSIKARYIRFRPIDWHGHISMRVELYGCQEGTPGGEFLFLFSFSLKKSAKSVL